MREKNQFGQDLGHLLTEWRAKEGPRLQVFIGQSCRLEPLSITHHTKDLFEVLCSKEHESSWTYLPYGPFYNYIDFEHWLKALLTAPDTMPYVIMNTSQHALGLCAFTRINPEHGSIEIAHVNYSKQLKKSTAATEAMYLMMRYAFEDLGFRRYEWKCNALNENSKKAALRLGFSFEGIFRQSHVFKQRNRDTAWFSIIDSEWPSIKARCERWLQPANFHADGQQKSSLLQKF